MAVPTKYPHHTINLTQPMERNDSFVAGAVIKPGYQIELYEDTGKKKWRPVGSATNLAAVIIALDNPVMNKGLTDTYAIGDQVNAGIFGVGGEFLAYIRSGQDISNGELLQPNGDGTFKSATSATADDNVGRVIAMEALGLVSVDTFCHMKVIAV